jgi:hypothetical protein
MNKTQSSEAIMENVTLVKPKRDVLITSTGQTYKPTTAELIRPKTPLIAPK